MNNEEEEDDECSVSASQIAEVYSTTFFLRNNMELMNSIDFNELDMLLWNMKPNYKVRDAFSILETHSKGSFI